MLLRFGAVVWLALVLASYPVLADRLASGGGAQAWAFYAAYSTAVIASVFLILDIRQLWITLTAVVRKLPIRSIVLLLNLLLVSLFIVFIGKHWGLIAVMFVGAAGLFVLLHLSDPKRLSVTNKTVRLSPATFAIIYVVLILGEVYLRSHPEAVGGGGGGNPALGKLYAGLYSYNSFGLRDVECSLTPPEGVFRILALGDSMTFGQGVADDESYAHQLQAMLDEDATGDTYQVINAGKPGANTASELRWLEEQGLKFAPNLVIVQFYLNDVSVDHSKKRTQSLYKTVMRIPEKSYALFFLRYRLWSLGESVRSVDFLGRLAQVIIDNERGWQECAQALDAFGRLSRDLGLPIVIVLFPHPGERREVIKVAHQVVADRCREAGLHVIDLVDAFLDVAPADQVVGKIDHHPSARVHGIAASEILESLRRLDLLPR